MTEAQTTRRRYSLMIFIIVVLSSGWLGVLVDFHLPKQPEGNSLGMGLWLVLPNSVLSLIAVSVASNFIKNIFEEFSWRGYLTPKLIEQKLNDWLIYLITGLVWALWHAAYYMVFLPDSYFETISRMGMLLSGCVLMVGWTVMYVEIYRLTKSVWPCVLMHAVEDGIPTLLVTVTSIITFTKNGDFWLNPTSGVITTILFLGIGLLLRSIRMKKDHSGISTGFLN